MERIEKKDIEVGQLYKGYGVLNEYGQFEFTPCKKMPQEQRMKIVRSGEDFTLYECKHTFRLAFTFRKGKDWMQTVQSFVAATSRAAVLIKEYF